MIELLSACPCQMTFGERAALEGILAQLEPDLAIEIGTAEGGSLRRIAAHSREVHSFDLVEPTRPVEELANVVLHTGDSHALLPEYLSALAGAGRNVDFALVDGDHTAEGVRRDVHDVLASEAVARTVILIHDTANEIVRSGLDMVDFGEWAKVKHVDLDFIPGHLSNGGPFHHQLWGGLGLVVVDSRPDVGRFGGPQEREFYSSFELFAAIRDGLVDAERTGRSSSPREVVAGGPTEAERVLQRDLERSRATLNAIQQSWSWRLTAPLRALKHAIGTRSSA